MKISQATVFPIEAERHPGWRLCRVAEQVAAALAMAAFVYAGFFLVTHFQEAMKLAVQPRATASGIYYLNCGAARAAGAAPISRGHPGYRLELDDDGDGIACEPYQASE